MNRRTPSTRFRPTLTALEGRDTPASPFAAFGAAAGGLPLAEVLRPDGTILARFQAFETGFTGGGRAAAGGLDGDPHTVEGGAGARAGGGARGPGVRGGADTRAVARLIDTV